VRAFHRVGGQPVNMMMNVQIQRHFRATAFPYAAAPG
jgi:hypothetical protein